MAHDFYTIRYEKLKKLGKQIKKKKIVLEVLTNFLDITMTPTRIKEHVFLYQIYDFSVTLDMSDM